MSLYEKYVLESLILNKGLLFDKFKEMIKNDLKRKDILVSNYENVEKTEKFVNSCKKVFLCVLAALVILGVSADLDSDVFLDLFVDMLGCGFIFLLMDFLFIFDFKQIIHRMKKVKIKNGKLERIWKWSKNGIGKILTRISKDEEKKQNGNEVWKFLFFLSLIPICFMIGISVSYAGYTGLGIVLGIIFALILLYIFCGLKTLLFVFILGIIGAILFAIITIIFFLWDQKLIIPISQFCFELFSIFFIVVEMYSIASCNKLTCEGKNIKRKLLGMKLFLRDYSNMNEKDLNEINLWDEYIIYSVILNENKRIKRKILRMVKNIFSSKDFN